VSGRPEYVHCALTGVFEGDPPTPVRKTWCGRPPEGFMFVDASHVALNGRGGGRLLCCPGCAAAIKVALDAGTWDGTS